MGYLRQCFDMNELKQYLKSKHLTQADFAAKLGVTQSRVSEWLTGKRRPGLDMALRIQQVTRGKVKAAVWQKKGEQE